MLSMYFSQDFPGPLELVLLLDLGLSLSGSSHLVVSHNQSITKNVTNWRIGIDILVSFFGTAWIYCD